MNQEAFAAWLKDRLTGERAEQEWSELFKGALEHLMAQPISALLTEAQVENLLTAHLSEAQLVALARPSVRLFLKEAVRDARTDDAPLKRFVSAEAEDKLLMLMSKPGVIHEAWINELFSQEAMEELLADTLYLALKDFSKIIPRMIESMTPSALGKLARLGGRATGGVTSKVLDEVEKRLEPEIKKWLERGTRKALDGAARFTVERIDAPSALEARRNMLRFFLSKSAAFHTASIGDQMIEEIDEVAELIARHLASLPETKARLSKVIVAELEKNEARSLRDWLRSIGVDQDPPYEAWASLSWPVWQTFLMSPITQLWLENLSGEICVLFSDSA